MGYAIILMKFTDGRIDTIGRDAIIDILTRHGLQAPPLQQGSNYLALPRDAAGYRPIGDSASLAVKNGEIVEFGLDRPEATEACRALLFSLVTEMGLTMFPDHGGEIYAREDVFADIPQHILSQFSVQTVVRQPQDCA